jgi:hypothetical protein
MPVILAMQEAEIRRIRAQSQLANGPHRKKRAGGVAQGVAPALRKKWNLGHLGTEIQQLKYKRKRLTQYSRG